MTLSLLASWPYYSLNTTLSFCKLPQLLLLYFVWDAKRQCEPAISLKNITRKFHCEYPIQQKKRRKKITCFTH